MKFPYPYFFYPQQPWTVSPTGQARQECAVSVFASSVPGSSVLGACFPTPFPVASLPPVALFSFPRTPSGRLRFPASEHQAPGLGAATAPDERARLFLGRAAGPCSGGVVDGGPHEVRLREGGGRDGAHEAEDREVSTTQGLPCYFAVSQNVLGAWGSGWWPAGDRKTG